ncbi:HTH domain-containing protein [Clostridium polynesiense]|uniref:HTH domain-containing protein n=1 Tax=Clostridium polynesiense TaxID=1325933 RepID=UPI0005900B5A|nr:HTH domain-containing protein [Clostridium polynesiense]
MITLTKRQKNIIRYLLELEDFIRIKNIALTFDVSERTLRYDLDIIEAYLKEIKGVLIRKPRMGIMIEDRDELKNKLKMIHLL